MRITCRDVSQSASALLDDDLPLPAWLSAKMHLLICRNCRAYVDQLRQTTWLVRSSLPRSLEAEEAALRLIAAQSLLDPPPAAARPLTSQGPHP